MRETEYDPGLPPPIAAPERTAPQRSRGVATRPARRRHGSHAPRRAGLRPRRRRGRAAVHAALTPAVPGTGRASGGCSAPGRAAARPARSPGSTSPRGSATTRPRWRPTGPGCAAELGVPVVFLAQVHGTRVATVDRRRRRRTRRTCPDTDAASPRCPGSGSRCWPRTACRCCWPTRWPASSARPTPAGSGPRPACCRPRWPR